MHIQQHVKTMAVSLTLCLAFGTILNAQDNRPNIVFILSDDQAWSDYGFMGHADIKTPHLDTLASSSLFFDRGYVAAPICRPSLASLVTGLFPHQHGVTGNDVAWGPDRSGYFSTKRHEMDAPLRAAFHENASFMGPARLDAVA